MILTAGDEYPCPRCRTGVTHRLHRAARPDENPASANNLYITCRGGEYFIGVEGREPVFPPR